MQEFKFGRPSTSDEPRSGRPSDATTTEMIKKIQRLVTDDRKLKVREISKIITTDRFNAVIKAKRPHLASKNNLFHQDNAPAHKAVKTMTKLTELKYESLPHPPYFPNLASCVYYLFPNLNRWLAGKGVYSNEEVIAETNAYFEEFSADYYKKGIELLETRWNKCIESEGNYVEE